MSDDKSIAEDAQYQVQLFERGKFEWLPIIAIGQKALRGEALVMCWSNVGFG